MFCLVLGGGGSGSNTTVQRHGLMGVPELLMPACQPLPCCGALSHSVFSWQIPLSCKRASSHLQRGPSSG